MKIGECLNLIYFFGGIPRLKKPKIPTAIIKINAPMWAAGGQSLVAPGGITANKSETINMQLSFHF
jgi:hypothetical protein